MKKFIPIFTIFVLSILIVFWQFLKIPQNLAYDEWEFAKLAL